MIFRTLDPQADRAAVDALFRAAADYILLERDEAPGPQVTDEFFTDTPPGCDPATNLRLGLFDGGTLIGVADTAFGYPETDDAYLGLMILAPAARGLGAGRRFLRHIEHQCRARGMKALFLAVFEANPRGRAFWEREGFTTRLAGRPVTVGQKTQMVRRMGKSL